MGIPKGFPLVESSPVSHIAQMETLPSFNLPAQEEGGMFENTDLVADGF